jgi:hypothetical protein
MRRARLTGIVLVLGIALALLMAFDCAAQSKKETVTDTKGKAGFDVLKGRWLRPDGGYIIEIRNVDSSGKMSADYFNPKPINVSRAEAVEDDGKMKVFIELRDTGYPGSTYTLTYDLKNDVLVGVYFQAVMKQNFAVYFTRMK